jgi:hypothetical protein
LCVVSCGVWHLPPACCHMFGAWGLRACVVSGASACTATRVEARAGGWGESATGIEVTARGWTVCCRQTSRAGPGTPCLHHLHRLCDAWVLSVGRLAGVSACKPCTTALDASAEGREAAAASAVPATYTQGMLTALEPNVRPVQQQGQRVGGSPPQGEWRSNHALSPAGTAAHGLQGKACLPAAEPV